MKNKLLFVALVAATSIHAATPASMSGSSRSLLGKKNTLPQDQKQQDSEMTGSSPAVYAGTPTTGMTSANQVVTANTQRTPTMVGTSSATWAPSDVKDASGNVIGTARLDAITSGITTGKYQATGQDAQNAIFIDQSQPDLAADLNQGALQKIGSVTTGGKTFDAYTINPNPVTTPASSDVSSAQSTDSGNDDFSDEDFGDDETDFSNESSDTDTGDDQKANE